MSTQTFSRLVAAVWLAAAGLAARPAAASPLVGGHVDDGDIGGSVTDSATGTPLPGGEVRISSG
ncbi:MAG TPA: hypothetical protein VGV12_09275, partial [Gemmatimonadales bacterium]|nr:hypothetical protein [Gemmatimonadales bacterium]